MRDYTGPLSAHFNLEVQSDHFGNGRSLSIEGCNIQYIDQDHEDYSEFYYHPFGDSRQDTSTIHAHMISLLNELQQCKKLKPKFTILESNDGYCKQYRCGVSLYFLSLLSSNFNITIDRMIGAPGHGKGIVDAINACDKRYLKEKMCMVDNHAMIGTKKTSSAVTCKRLLKSSIRVHGVKSYNKHITRETIKDRK